MSDNEENVNTSEEDVEGVGEKEMEESPSSTLIQDKKSRILVLNKLLKDKVISQEAYDKAVHAILIEIPSTLTLSTLHDTLLRLENLIMCSSFQKVVFSECQSAHWGEISAQKDLSLETVDPIENEYYELKAQPFQWKDGGEVKNMGRLSQWLYELFRTKKYKIHNIHGQTDFLSFFTYGKYYHGGSDFVITDAKATDLKNNIYIILESKVGKPTQRDKYQSMLELVSASYNSNKNSSIYGVVSNFNEYWTYFWFSGDQTLCQMDISSFQVGCSIMLFLLHEVNSRSTVKKQKTSKTNKKDDDDFYNEYNNIFGNATNPVTKNLPSQLNPNTNTNNNNNNNSSKINIGEKRKHIYSTGGIEVNIMDFISLIRSFFPLDVTTSVERECFENVTPPDFSKEDKCNIKLDTFESETI